MRVCAGSLPSPAPDAAGRRSSRAGSGGTAMAGIASASAAVGVASSSGVAGDGRGLGHRRRRHRIRGVTGDRFEQRWVEELGNQIGGASGPPARPPGHDRGDHGHDGHERGDDG